MSDANASYTSFGDSLLVANNHGVININTVRSPKFASVLSEVVFTFRKGIRAGQFSEDTTCYDDYDIDTKINHNQLVRYAPFVRCLWMYSLILESCYKTLDAQDGGSKGLVVATIHSFYQEVLGDFQYKCRGRGLSEIEVIRLHADDIFDGVKSKADKFVRNGFREGVEIYEEEVNLGVKCLVSHAMVECKVLQPPPKP